MAGTTRFVILSVQRSGSTMLIHDLRCHPGVGCYGEVYRRANTSPASYRAYRAALPWRPAGAHLDRLFDRPEQAVGFKIMYNQLRLPSLKSALRRRDVKIVHLVRDNVLKQLVSHLVASRRQIFASTEPVAPTQVDCPIDGLLDALEGKQREIERHRRWCLTFDHVELRYEALLADRQEQHRRLLTFLAVDPSVPLDGGRVKLNPDQLEGVVANYGQVVEALSGTRFAALLD